ncbi:Leucine--tRNA ligase [Babesia sp. Xinjiang]|uniref:Leucine--tRNA ligase n=1 Tax=Babesia sp. Xinjiang TaxID=462227 RepID=UPI000A22469E|nr:Leucine--tRNA ligase [Babesia sp. Xinjiang]ORM41327.1 Leucine--tRNA ligase [Babesia sp. Xinjiang]
MSNEIAELETKWQRFWDDNEVFKAEEGGEFEREIAHALPGELSNQQPSEEKHMRDNYTNRPKFYGLCMIPYPSGDGLHVGHLLGYTALDVICRYKRMKGYRVLCPIGWDSFGLPAERYAEQVNRDVREVTKENIEKFKSQVKRMGFAYDWSRELATSDPKYYKWTQWMFQRFHECGIAYRDKQMVNWCPELNTVLANEEVKNGLSERGGYQVYRKGAEQWLLRISQYAKRLTEGLDSLEWPSAIVDAQKKWIGLEHGYKVTFRLENSDHATIALYGFETDLERIKNVECIEVTVDMDNLSDFVHPSAAGRVENLVQNASKMSNLERYDNKLLEDTGVRVLNPITGQPIKVFVTNTPLLFSKPINCRIVSRNLTQSNDTDLGNNVTPKEHGVSGLDPSNTCSLINVEVKNSYTGSDTQPVGSHERGPDIEPFVNVKMKDWIFSRCRYWGEPIPLKRHDGQYIPVDEELLPLETGPEHEETMPQWAGSSWHYLRFCDPSNDKLPFDKNRAETWMPVDLYVGGTEHTVSHLLYARFWNKVLFDLGISPVEEPFKRILLHGIIRNATFSVNGQPIDPQLVVKHKGRYVLQEDQKTEVDVKLEKMSKSKNNVISPDDIIDNYGADALRLHLLFLGPIRKDKVWSEDGLAGVAKLLDRIYDLFRNVVITENSDTTTEVNKLVEDITWDIENHHFNLAVASFFKFCTYLENITKNGTMERNVANTFLRLLAPFAPHLAEELWHLLNPNFIGSILNTSFPLAVL